VLPAARAAACHTFCVTPPALPTLTCRAAWLGDTAAIAEYAAAGGNVNAADRKGQTPLQFAAGGAGRTALSKLCHFCLYKL
jgi:hypothetical protein